MPELSIRIDSPNAIDDLGSLLTWLKRDQSLVGQVATKRESPETGQMGLIPALVVALGSSSSVGALARSLRTWMVQRRSDLIVEIRAADGRSVRVDAKRIADAESLIKRALAEPRDDG